MSHRFKYVFPKSDGGFVATSANSLIEACAVFANVPGIDLKNVEVEVIIPCHKPKPL
jgi:hypothetical protein